MDGNEIPERVTSKIGMAEGQQQIDKLGTVHVSM